MLIEVLTDSYGNSLEMNLGNVMILKLEDEATAKDLSATFDMLIDNLVIPDKRLDNSQNLKSLRLKITGIDTSGLLQTDMQTIKPLADGLELDIVAQAVPPNPPTRPITLTEVAEYLKSDPFEQSDDPQIIELADKIVAGEKNSWEAAKKINSWVYPISKRNSLPIYPTLCRH